MCSVSTMLFYVGAMMTLNTPMTIYLQHGKTPLMVASHFGHVDCVKEMLAVLQPLELGTKLLSSKSFSLI